MSDVRLIITDREFQQRLARLRSGTTDATPLMRIWGEIGHQSVSENFEVGGRPQHWAPLSPRTIQARIGARKSLRGKAAAHIRGNNPFAFTALRILVVSGTLQKITVKAERTRVILGANPAARSYAAIHQFGGQAGRGHKVTIPARPYLLLQEEDKAEMRNETRRYLQKLSA